MPLWFDHLFAALLLGVVPVYSVLCGKKFLEAMEREGRVSVYRSTIVSQWAQALVMIGAWLWVERSWADLGLGLPTGTRFWVVLAVVVGLFVHQLWQLRKAHGDEAFRARLRPQLEGLEVMVPETPRDRRWFNALACTAGFCEELLYRGFVLWYLSTWMPVWVALLVSSLAFGLLHWYEGPKAAGSIVGVAVTFGVLYLASGSLWIPMVAHAVFDVLQVRMAMAVLDVDGAGGASTEAEPEGEPSPEVSTGPLQLLAQPDA